MKVGGKVFIGTFVLGLVFVGMILLISSLGDKGKTDSSAKASEMGDVPQITSRVAPDAHTNNEQQAGSAVKMVTVASKKQREAELKKKIAEAMSNQ